MNVLPMDRVREALESAVEERWELRARQEPPPVAPERDSGAPQPVVIATPAKGMNGAGGEHARPPIATATLGDDRLVAADRSNPQREAFCLLQTAIARRMADEEIHSLGVTSPRSGQGKTLTATNLAVGLACEPDRQVLLIDLNLRRPKVHEFFDQTPSVGVEGCLFGGIRLDEALFKASIDSLLVLPARGDSQNVHQVLKSENLRALLAETRERFPEHLTVVDLPPLSTPAEDARVFESLVDSLLLVVDDQVTRETDLRSALAALDKSKLLGSVLNNSSCTS